MTSNIAIFSNWQNFALTLTLIAELLQSKYYRNSSGKNKVFDYGKLTGNVPK